jgi:hypothetical protein
MTVYESDQPVRALACIQQYQFCNPSLRGDESCTPLKGIFEAARTASSTIFSHSKDKEGFLWSLAAIKDMAGGFTELSITLKGGSLLAGDYLSALGQDGLPTNQWELELEHWFKFTLADLQRAILVQLYQRLLLSTHCLRRQKRERFAAIRKFEATLILRSMCSALF